MYAIRSFLFTIITLLTTSLAFAQNFEINGKTMNIADGTWLFLSRGTMDSCQVKNAEFKFQGVMKEPQIQCMIHDKGYQDYVGLWIEPSNMTITLKKGEFRYAKLNGSKTEQDALVLKVALKPIDDKENNLEKEYNSTTDSVKRQNIYAKGEQLENDRAEVHFNFIRQYPNSIVATSLLASIARDMGKVKVQQLYDALSIEMKNTYYGAKIREFIALNKEVKVGSQFEDFEQKDTEGKNVRLSQIRGKYTLVEFWGSWCIPCREEFPNLIKTYNLYKNRGFTVLGVAAELDQKLWLKAVKDDGLPWINVSDLQGDQNAAAVIYGVNSYPTNYLINERGIIIEKNLYGDKLNQKLEELLR